MTAGPVSKYNKRSVTKFAEPHTLATGDSFEDSMAKLALVVESASKTETVWVSLTEAIAFDSAYDHFSACYGPLDGSEGVYYTQNP